MKHRRNLIFFLLTTAVLLCLSWLPLTGHGLTQDDAPLALVLTADGPVAPAMAEYLERGLTVAERRGAEVVIFQLNTPGGSIDIMNRMVQTIRASETPIIVYVAPRGAIAGSAGTVITLAGHAAAMAPETAIGAASPVGSEGEDLDETLAAKQKNILRATVRSLAEKRPAEAVALAENTIESADAVSASEAYAVGLVDFIARNISDLLGQADGFTVEVDNREVTLNTRTAQIEELESSFIEDLLTVLANPNIVFLLIAIGVQAILIEISSPGGWIAGFIGVVCLSLAVYGLGILPVNWFGMIFLALAFVLFILDIKAPTHGALTAAGVASLIVGGLVLFNAAPAVPGFQPISVPLVVGASVVMGGMFFVIMLFAIRAQKAPARMGQESLTGRIGIVHTDLTPRGLVQLEGEQWSAEVMPGEAPILRGARVRVMMVDGLKLIVRHVQDT